MVWRGLRLLPVRRLRFPTVYHDAKRIDGRTKTSSRRMRRTRSSRLPLNSRRPPPPPQAPAQPDVLGQLQQLGELKAAGVLTEEEFAAQKAKILAS